MALMVVDGAALSCPFGTIPGTLKVTSQMAVLAAGKWTATLSDMVGKVNISGFGMCTSLTNPQVAAATAAALGVLTPQPCMFVSAAPWMTPKLMPLAKNIPCLCSDSRIMCTLGMGMISVVDPGQGKVVV